jgi:putative DNA primase/helicase
MSNDDKISPELSFAQSVSNNDFAIKDGMPFRWVGTHWQEVELVELEREALRFVAKIAPHKASEKTAASAVKTAILYAAKLPTSTHTYIPTLSGYISIEGKTATLVTAKKECGITYILNCDYNQIGFCPLFDAFLIQALPDPEIRNFIQEYAGYTLLGDSRHQLAVWLIGGGGTGKGTFTDIMASLHRNAVALSIDALDGFNLMGLQSASLVCVDETPARIDEERLKSIVSGNQVKIDIKYRDPISIHPKAKWIICGNQLPSISDQSDGFWRRWFVIPFNVKPAVKIPLLAEKIIEKELSGVLNWALEGLKRLLERGSFPPVPQEMRDAQQKGRQQSNSVSEWVEDDGIQYEESCMNTRADVYERYSSWCSKSGSKSVGSQKFWERLRQVFPLLPEDRHAARATTIGGKRRAFVHIAMPAN